MLYLIKNTSVDQLLRDGEYQLSHIKKEIPANCFSISRARSWLTLARILVLTGMFIGLESLVDLHSDEGLLWKLPLLLLLWFLHGQTLMGLFVLGHDCGHGTFSKDPRLNSIVGHLCFSPLGTGLGNWTATHNQHHAHTQKRGLPVDWSSRLLTRAEFERTSWKNDFAIRLGYLLPFGIFYWVWLNAVQRGSMRKATPAIRGSNLVMWSVMLAIYVSLWYFAGAWPMFKYHGIPAFIAMVTGYFVLIIQHAGDETVWYEEKTWSPVKGQLAATFDVRFPRWLEWLWLDINIHIPHHVSPNIPWYNLREASQAIKGKFPQLYQERRMTLRDLTWLLRTPFIRHVPSEGVYRLK